MKKESKNKGGPTVSPWSQLTVLSSAWAARFSTASGSVEPPHPQV